VLESTGEPAELPPVLDVEAENLEAAKVGEFLDAFERLAGTRMIIYSSPGYWNSNMAEVDVSGHDLWVANWGVSAPGIPAGWSTWTFWQQTSEGQIPGHSGSLDINVFNGTEAELRAYASGGGEMSLEDRVEVLENLIAALEQRVTVLESGQSTEPSEPSEPSTPGQGAMLKVVAESGLNFRTEPKVDASNVIRKLVGGNTLWYLVREQVQGKRGYAHSAYFEVVGS
jgi:hypothetical protein